MFVEELDTTLGEDAEYLRSMIEDKVLLKYHHWELMKEIALPSLPYP